jgi:hypothetical protein
VVADQFAFVRQGVADGAGFQLTDGDRIAARPISRENLSKSVDNPIKSPAIKAMPG